MAGNVWEWVSDSYYSIYYASFTRENPAEPSLDENAKKVVRGGSWNDHPLNVRVRNRYGGDASSRSEGVGFRCARSP